MCSLLDDFYGELVLWNKEGTSYEQMADRLCIEYDFLTSAAVICSYFKSKSIKKIRSYPKEHRNIMKDDGKGKEYIQSCCLRSKVLNKPCGI